MTNGRVEGPREVHAYNLQYLGDRRLSYTKVTFQTTVTDFLGPKKSLENFLHLKRFARFP